MRLAFRDISIRRKQVIIIMLTSMVALVTACVSFMIYDSLTFRRELGQRLASIAVVLGHNLTAAIDFDDPEAAAETLSALHSQRNITSASVRLPDGWLFALYQREHRRMSQSEVVEISGEDVIANHLHVVRPIEREGETIGTIEVVTSLDELSARLWRYGSIAAGVLAGSLLLVYFISARLERLVSGPILELARTARRIGLEKNYSLRVTKRGDDEIGELINGFNEMLGEIESRDRALQNAHDLLEQRVVERTAALQQAQEEAAREQARFKFIFESLPVGIAWMVHGDLGTRIANPAYERISGVALERCRDLPLDRAATHPDDREHEQELRRRLHAGEIDHYAMEKRYVRADGSVCWTALSVRHFEDPATREVQEIAAFVDVTELKESEGRLAHSLAVLNATLESTVDGVLVGDHEGRLTRHNRRFAEMWRLSDDLASGDAESAIAAVLDQVKDPENFVARVRQLFAERDADSFDVLEFKDGRVFERYSRPQRINGLSVGRVWCFRDITERRRAELALETAHRQLLETSRQAGMAEVATGVLHNVGNVLNSVNVSATLVAERVRDSEVGNLTKVAALLRQQEGDLAGFFAKDARGGKIPGFLQTLAEHFVAEKETVLAEVEQLRRNVEHIKEIVAMQQSYARVSGIAEATSVTEMVEDSVRMNIGALTRHDVKLVRDYQVSTIMTVEKHKVLQILVNLIRNAKYACDDSGRADKQLVVRTTGDAEHVWIEMIDNGIGISPENLTRIFSHGFTTRKEGHGFGLHSGALAAKELGGSLSVFSAGSGHGATFKLQLPINRDRRET